MYEIPVKRVRITRVSDRDFPAVTRPLPPRSLSYAPRGRGSRTSGDAPARYRVPIVSSGGCGSSAKKSFPLSSTMMNAGKSRTSIRQTASMPSSGYSRTSTLVMQSWASLAAAPPMEPR